MLGPLGIEDLVDRTTLVPLLRNGLKDVWHGAPGLEGLHIQIDQYLVELRLDHYLVTFEVRDEAPLCQLIVEHGLEYGKARIVFQPFLVRCCCPMCRGRLPSIAFRELSKASFISAVEVL